MDKSLCLRIKACQLFSFVYSYQNQNGNILLHKNIENGHFRSDTCRIKQIQDTNYLCELRCQINNDFFIQIIQLSKNRLFFQSKYEILNGLRCGPVNDMIKNVIMLNFILLISSEQINAIFVALHFFSYSFSFICDKLHNCF